MPSMSLFCVSWIKYHSGGWSFLVRQLSSSIALLGLMVACGCGGDGPDVPALGTVTGKVTTGGQPVVNAIVTFTPASGGRPSSGQTGTDGTYTLMYNVDNAGATIGQHTVMVTGAGESGDYEGDDPSVTEDDEEGEGSTGPADAASDGPIKKDVAAGPNTINIEL
jgi:hypothetical protein